MTHSTCSAADYPRAPLRCAHERGADRQSGKPASDYLDPGKPPPVRRAPEVKEETGWWPRAMDRLINFADGGSHRSIDNIVSRLRR